MHTIASVRTLQRLFSTFPDSWPGVGLLLIRLCLSLALFHFGFPGPPGKSSESIAFAETLITAAAGILLVAGLWTPVVGVLTALREISIALSLSSVQQEDSWIHGFLAVIAASAAMLGPGAWSIDARLFGRKRIEIDRTAGKKTSL